MLAVLGIHSSPGGRVAPGEGVVGPGPLGKEEGSDSRFIWPD